MLSHVTDVGHEGGADFLQELEVNVLPLVQFYAGGKRVEAFPCGPRKIELLREKLEKWQSWHNHTTAGMDGGTKIPSSYVHDPYHTGGEKASHQRIYFGHAKMKANIRRYLFRQS